jgi:two-component system chemotaxis response regulator CheB
MGADGREGCRALKSLGAKVWAQDEQTSVVYGMPQAVTVANIAELNLPIQEFTQSIITEMRVK